MQGRSTTITHPDSGETRTFAFDHSYWSHDGYRIDQHGVYVGTDDRYADQVRGVGVERGEEVGVGVFGWVVMGVEKK
jgi:hypothetical protein